MIFPTHFENILENLKEIEILTSIHTQISGKTPGRKTKVEVLNKSAIVLITACWETFVEDLVEEAFNELLSNAKDYKAFPNKVLAKAVKDIKSNPNNNELWKLAGEGWKDVLKNYKNNSLKQKIDYFHVPRPENIDILYEDLLGIKNICSNWYWKNMNNQNARNLLNKFIDYRGAIAHKVSTNNSILKKDVNQYLQFIKFASIILHNRVNSHLQSQLNMEIWKTYQRGSVK